MCSDKLDEQGQNKIDRREGALPKPIVIVLDRHQDSDQWRYVHACAGLAAARQIKEFAFIQGTLSKARYWGKVLASVELQNTIDGKKENGQIFRLEPRS